MNYTFDSIYSNTSPFTKHNLRNNLFQHTLGWNVCERTYFIFQSKFHPVQKYFIIIVIFTFTD